MSYYKINYTQGDETKTYYTNKEKEKILFTVRRDNQVNIETSFSFRLTHSSNYNMNNSLVNLYDLLNHDDITTVEIYLISDNEHESLLYSFEKIQNISLEFELYEDTSISPNNIQNTFETRVVMS